MENCSAYVPCLAIIQQTIPLLLPGSPTITKLSPCAMPATSPSHPPTLQTRAADGPTTLAAAAGPGSPPSEGSSGSGGTPLSGQQQRRRPAAANRTDTVSWRGCRTEAWWCVKRVLLDFMLYIFIDWFWFFFKPHSSRSWLLLIFFFFFESHCKSTNNHCVVYVTCFGKISTCCISHHYKSPFIGAL